MYHKVFMVKGTEKGRTTKDKMYVFQRSNGGQDVARRKTEKNMQQFLQVDY